MSETEYNKEPGKHHSPATFAAVLFLMLLSFTSHPVFAQNAGAGTLGREIEKALPPIKREAPAVRTAPIETGKPLVTPKALAQHLPSPIRVIDVDSPILQSETKVRLRERFLDKASVSNVELEAARNDIWSLYRKHGRLAHVELSVIPGEKASGGSRLRARVVEIRVRKVLVRQEGTAMALDQSLMDGIRRGAEEEFSGNRTLDMDNLAARLKRRLFLGDVSLRASIEPVDPEHIDLKILVSAKAKEPAAFLAQYDNTGTWVFGADRFIGGMSKSSLLLKGDRLNVTGLKTMDIGSLDGQGMYYGRVSYEAPVIMLGTRFSVWGSGLRYHALSGLTAGSNATGKSYEAGGGAHRPLYMGADFSAIGHLEFLEKWETDRLLTGVVSADKLSHNGRVKVDLDKALSPTQMLGANLTATFGRMDLSGNAAALAQDQLGPRVNGNFTKFEGGGRWLGRFGEGNKVDTRLEVKGQLASKNLDSMDEFSLGGPTGLRAFSPSEATGDQGYIASAEMGYAVLPWLRAAAFYDVGGTRRNKNVYAADAIPNSYILQDAGMSLSAFFKSVDANLGFAHEIGRNPGLPSSGLDADNTSQRFRVFAALTYRF